MKTLVIKLPIIHFMNYLILDFVVWAFDSMFVYAGLLYDRVNEYYFLFLFLLLQFSIHSLLANEKITLIVKNNQGAWSIIKVYCY